MSNNIWNNPLMWQTKKTGSDSGDEFDFDFDINSDTGFDADFEEVQDGYQAFKQESSLADAAAKAGQYTEKTPEMAGGGNPASDIDKKISSVFDNTTPEASQPNYSLNISWGEDTGQALPSLQSLTGNPSSGYSNITQFNDDDDSNIIIIEKLGITTDSVFDKGVAIGLSPIDVANNLDTLREAMALEILTGDSFDSQELTELYQASLNGDIGATQTILNNNNVQLNGAVSINDIMALSQNANNKIFKSAYLN